MGTDSRNKGHAIVCGFGHLGNRVVSELLSRGCSVTVIDKSGFDQNRRRALSETCRLVEGDIRDDEVLSQAGVERATSLLAITGDYLANLQAAITARGINNDIDVVVRIYDQSFARQVESTFGFRALSASFLASPAYLSAATDDSLLAMLNIDGSYMSVRTDDYEQPASAKSISVVFDGNDLRIRDRDTELQEESDSFRVSVERSARRLHSRRKMAKRLSERMFDWRNRLKSPHLLPGFADVWNSAPAITKGILSAFLAFGLLSVLIFSCVGGLRLLDALYFVVTTMTTVGYGDFNLQNAPPALKLYGIVMMLSGAGLLATIYAMIADRVLSARVDDLLGRHKSNLSGHTVVVGLGKVGYCVAHGLKMLGIDVVGVEACEDSDNVGSARMHFPVIIGDASKPSILSNSAVEDADVLLALTDDEMLNLSIALHARDHNKNIKTVIRTYDPVLATKFAGFGFENVLSTSAVAAPAFVDAAMYRTVRGSFICHGRDVLVATHKIEPQCDLDGLTPLEVGIRDGMAIVLGRDDDQGEYSILPPDVPLSAGMSVVVLLSREQVDRLV